MGRYYGEKIRNGVINPKTGEPWKIEDVKEYWRPAVQKWLDENGEA